jgi:hypothetical protein
MNRPVERAPTRVRRWIALSVGLPWIWLSSVYATWLVARASLGRSPRPLLDDPKHIGDAVGTAHAVSAALLTVLLPGGILSVVAALWLGGSRRLHWKAVGWWLSALVLSWLSAVFYGRLDPGRVLAWFID